MDIYFSDLSAEKRNLIKEQDLFYCTPKQIRDELPLAKVCATTEPSYISGEWQHISKLIPILKDMEYYEFHLSYEDCNVWRLEWNTPELTGLIWELVSTC